MKSYEELQEAYDRLKAENESLKTAAEEIKTVYEKQKEINKNYVDEVYELQKKLEKEHSKVIFWNNKYCALNANTGHVDYDAVYDSEEAFTLREDELLQEIDTLKEQMKDMRCCGNCQHEQTGCSTDAIKNNFCEYWVIK